MQTATSIIKHTGLFEMIVGVLATCHTQYTWDRSIFIFLFNRTTLLVFVTYFTGALYVHHLWFYKHQHDNRVRSLLSQTAYQCFTFTHAPCLLKLCIPPSNGIVRWWLFLIFVAELLLDNCNWPTFIKRKQTKRLLCAVRRHLSKLRYKRRNA
jgi:hypothetical protein